MAQAASRAGAQIPQFEPLEQRLFLAAEPVISEFMASNNNTLMDYEGDSSDWIEIWNKGTDPIDLGQAGAQWHLTNKSDNLTKWTFPDVTIQANGYLVVFASGKNKVMDNEEIHTNFKLSVDGDYLALVDPAGNKVSEFTGSTFPAQSDDVSYGTSERTADTTVVTTGSSDYVLVPTDGSMETPGNEWYQLDPGFDYTNWLYGQTGVGYEIPIPTPVPTPTPSPTASIQGASTFYYGPFGTNGTWNLYEVVTSTQTWINAYNAAKARTQLGVTGHLVSITSAAENTFVKGFLPGTSWIGLTDSTSSTFSGLGTVEYGNMSTAPLPIDGAEPTSSQCGAGFKWVTGEPLTYQSWAAGAPNNNNNVPATEPGEDGVSISTSGTWNDEKSGEGTQTGVTKTTYVVEYDIGCKFVYGPYGPGGSWNLYQVINNAGTWLDAYNAAKAMNQRGKAGHLVSITSAAENNFVKGLLGGTVGWIGLTDSTSSTFSGLGTAEYGNTSTWLLPPDGSPPTTSQRGAGFKWVSGDSFTYQNWSGGQPDDGAGAGTEDGVEIIADGTWADNKDGEAGQTGVNRNAYVVEYDLGDRFFYGPYGTNGAYNLYQVVSNTGAWVDAYNAANASAQRGVAGHLAVITSAGENNFIKGLLTTTSWIGLTDSSTYATGASEQGNTSGLPLPADGTAPVSGKRGYGFAWVKNSGGSTESFTYQNWAGTQPDDGGGAGAESAVEIATDGTWADRKNGASGQTGFTRNAYVVEYDLGERFFYGPYGPGGTWNLYELDNSSKTWTAAKADAETQTYGGKQGHLVTIGSAAENAFIKTFISSNSWIGLTDSETFGGTEGTFVWVTGEPFTYQKWNSGQPDNASPGQDAVYITTGTGNSGGTWYDEKSGEGVQTGVTKPYVIEYNLGLPSLGPSFTVTEAHATKGVYTISNAVQLLASPSARSYAFPFINFADPENIPTTDRFGGSLAFGGNTTANDLYFAMRATALVKIPTTGTYTFGVRSDDGFSLKIDGAVFTSFTALADAASKFTAAGDTLAHPTSAACEAIAVTSLTAGEHLIELVYFQSAGAAGVELYAATGAVTAWNANLFRLVGDVINGGLPIRGIKDSVATDLAAVMRGINTTAYVRIPFSVVDPTQVDRLTLRLKYGDGFVAYLNGEEVARANAPTTLAYNSAATGENPYYLATQYVDFDLSLHRGDLVAGDNILAIRLLNNGPVGGINDLDSLLDAQLVLGKVLSTSLRFFTTPTPGAPNNQGVVETVANVKFSQDHGLYDTPFDLVLTCVTPGAQIRYTLDFSAPTATTGIVYTGPIHISTTTIVRAAAYLADWDPCEGKTQTYIFLDAVLAQPALPAGFPTQWVTATGGTYAYPPDYGMDDTIANDPRYAATLREDLQMLPTLSIATSIADIFGPTGIYPNAYLNNGDLGSLWEVAASTEFIDPNGGPEFQINNGLRIYGGVNRSQDFPKHSFRIDFTSDYGPTKLDFDLFEDPSAVQSFDTLILRGEFNDSWPYRSTDPAQRARGIMTRDQWMRQSMADMGDPSSHYRYVHLYIDGLYWGVYTITERPDNAFQSSYFGGTKDQWDVNHDTTFVAGDNVNWNAMMAVVNDGTKTADEKFQILKDNHIAMTEYIDYMILNMYGNNNDWDDHNWYAARERTPDGRWRFFIWDGERVLEGPTESGKIGVNQDNRPSRIYGQIKTSAEFKMLWADRVQKAFFNDGALTPENTAARMQALQQIVDPAVVAESARWGDFNYVSPFVRDPPFTRDNEYLTEMTRLYTQYFPVRTGNTLGLFVTNSLYPSVGNLKATPFYAPNFSQFGGEVAPGFALAISNPDATGTIYYTTDGTDPRAVGGAVAGSAYTDPISITQSTTVKARIYDGTVWSALMEVPFYVDTPLRVTEIMYNPGAPPAGSSYTTQAFEYIELQDISGAALALAGIRLAGAVDFTFTDQVLAAGERAVVAADPDAFASRYGSGITILGTYAKSLSNAGETVQLLDTAGQEILHFHFKDGWYPLADGDGFSMVVADPMQNRGLWDSKDGWRTSWQEGGNPGAADTGVNPDAIVVNEVVAHQNFEPPGDWVELYNTTGAAVNLSGWYLSDSGKTDHDMLKYRIPDGTVIGAHSYLVLTETGNFGKAFDDSSWSTGTSGLGYDLGATFGPYISTNVQAAMYGVNSTLYVRIPFTNTIDPDTLTSLTLEMRYDDGFVAYLNGVEIARRNAPAVRPWNATATADHPDDQSIVYEDIDVTKHLGALKSSGPNILAIRALNQTASDSNFLLQAQLVSGTTTFVAPDAAVKYLVPTDGSTDQGWMAGQFALSELGDEIILTSPPSPSIIDPTDLVPGGYRYDEKFMASDRGYAPGDVQGVSFVRYIKSTGAKDFVYGSARTPGAANAGPLVGPVVINEIMYNPANPAATRDEYIELYNITDNEVRLYDPLNPANTWKFTDGIDFAFPTGASIPAHGYALVVGIDPALFRSRHPDVPPSVTIYGPYTGVPNDAGETLELSRPGDPEPAPSTVVPYYRVDQVTYDISGAWPTRADGRGSSLERLDPTAYGNDPANWAASTNFGTPGRDNVFLDTTAPSTPVSVSATPASESTMTITWTPSTDPESGVAYYKIYRDHVNVGASATATFTDIGVALATTYTYEVSAVNYDDVEGSRQATTGRLVVLTSAAGADTTTIKAVFAETVQRDSAQVISNYRVTYNSGQIAVSEVALLPDQKTVLITLTSAMAVGTTYTVTANNVVAQSGYTVAANTAKSFAYTTPAANLPTYALREYWSIISGSNVTDLTNNTNYPYNPTAWTDLTGGYFESPSNFADSYGERVRAYITPPTTGIYTFYIASDDNSELWMDTDGPGEGIPIKIASVSGYTSSRQWDKYASQKSVAISLTAGTRYYIEARHKEGTGNDYLAVTWVLPGGTFSSTQAPIASSYLTPYLVPSFTVDVEAQDPSASEAGLDKGTFRITRSNAADPLGMTRPLTVYYTVTGTTFTTDYSENLGWSATIPADATYVDVNVTPIDDSVDEPDETVKLNLLPDIRYSLGAASATVTIADNDLPTVSVAATDPFASEAGLDKATFTFTRVGDLSAALTVNYSVTGGTATPDDYEPLAGPVAFVTGQATATMDLVPTDNKVTEPDKTVVLAISTDPGYTVTGTPATATINEFPVVTDVRLNSNAGRGPSAVDPSGQGVRTITVNFSESVTFAAGDVTVETVAFPSGSSEVARTITSATVAGSNTATMTITLPFGEAMDTWVRVRLSGSGIEDLTGYRLDGDARSGNLYIVDAATDLPTGDGKAGGDAVFYVGSLRGDFNGDSAVTADDKAGFLAAWRAKSLDADFRGVGAGVRPPDGKITLGDMDGFTSVYLGAVAAGRHLDPLPVAGGGLAAEVTPLPTLTTSVAGIDILAQAAGLLPLSQQTAPLATGPQGARLVQGDEEPLDLLRLRRLRPVAVIQSADAVVLRV